MVFSNLRLQARISALDVEELFHSDISSEPGFGNAEPILR